jgi:hypothetical protein
MYKYIFTPTVSRSLFNKNQIKVFFFFIQIDFTLKFNYEGMTSQIPKTEEEEAVNIVTDNEEKQNQQQEGNINKKTLFY